MLIFEKSKAGRTATAQSPNEVDVSHLIPEKYQRGSRLGMPQASELDVVRHYTQLSQKNFAIDTNF